jgi:hypothetical protein
LRGGGVRKKEFFFEKKNQKTFASWQTVGRISYPPLPSAAAKVADKKSALRSSRHKSFLLLFFKKEELSTPPAPHAAAPGSGKTRAR